MATTVVSVASSATAVTLKAANTARIGLSIYNKSTANLYVKRGADATVELFSFMLEPGDFYELPPLPRGPFAVYPGIVTGIWASANGLAEVTEDS